MPELHARVDDRAARAIIAFARAREVSMSALATAVGHWLDEHPGQPPDHLEKCIEAIVEDAERIDAERRERKPRAGG